MQKFRLGVAHHRTHPCGSHRWFGCQRATADSGKWDELAKAFIAQYGPVARYGLIQELIWDARSQDYGSKEPYDPAKILAHLFPDIDRKKWPSGIDAVEQVSQTDFIRHCPPQIPKRRR